MKVTVFKQSAMLSSVVAVAVFGSGCGQQASEPTDGSTLVAEASHDDHEGHDHSGWWCAEHGVPEEECSLCSASAAEGFKEKGDWCQEHDLADSQCFVCHPELEAKFAARYEAKYGEKPPKL